MSAVISPCGKYRYRLERQSAGTGSTAVIMVNPSTADAEQDDATIRKLVSEALGDHDCGNRRGLKDRLITDIAAALARPRAAVETFLAAILAQSPNGEPVTVAYHPNGDWSVYDSPRAAVGEQSRERFLAATIARSWMHHAATCQVIIHRPTGDGYIADCTCGLAGVLHDFDKHVLGAVAIPLQSPPAKVEG